MFLIQLAQSLIVKMKFKKSQVWVETAVYTLIGLTIIGILLAAATPQIEKMKDKSVVEQTLSALNSINEKIIEVEQAPGSIRIVYLKISEGNLIINPSEDKLKYVLENTRYEMSEVGERLREGDVFIETKEYGNERYQIELTLEYSNRINLTSDSGEELKTIQTGAKPYELYIANPGDNDYTERTHIDINYA